MIPEENLKEIYIASSILKNRLLLSSLSTDINPGEIAYLLDQVEHIDKLISMIEVTQITNSRTPFRDQLQFEPELIQKEG